MPSFLPCFPALCSGPRSGVQGTDWGDSPGMGLVRVSSGAWVPTLSGDPHHSPHLRRAAWMRRWVQCWLLASCRDLEVGDPAGVDPKTG